MISARAALAVTVAGLVLAACGSGDSGDETEPVAGDGGSAAAEARTVEHALGETEIDGTPERVVALEFSFVQALDSLGVEPVGIADDDEPERIEQLLGRTVEYTSVGTRLEPNLELVSSLQPDLIIADETRHAAVYEQLSDIAPTIVLNSWEGSYQDIKDAVVTIAGALGDEQEGRDVVAAHEAAMADIAAGVPASDDRRYLLAVATPDAMSLHTATGFTGSVFQALGLTPAIETGEPVESGVGIERLLAVNPDVLFVATDGPGTVLEEWQTNSAWTTLAAAQNDAVYEVDRNQFARFRGLTTAEAIATDIVGKITSAP